MGLLRLKAYWIKGCLHLAYGYRCTDLTYGRFLPATTLCCCQMTLKGFWVLLSFLIQWTKQSQIWHEDYSPLEEFSIQNRRNLKYKGYTLFFSSNAGCQLKWNPLIRESIYNKGAFKYYISRFSEIVSMSAATLTRPPPLIRLCNTWTEIKWTILI